MGHGRDKRDPPARRCRSMGHGRDKRDPPAPMPFDGARSRQARPSRATIPEDKREGRACRVRLRNVASARATCLGEPHATRLGQKTKPDANTHLAERDWRREGDLNPRYGD